MEIPQIIAKLVMNQNTENLMIQQLVVLAKINIMMMNVLNFVNLVIIHGKFQ